MKKKKIKIPKKNEFGLSVAAISVMALMLFCLSLSNLLTEPVNNLSGIAGTKFNIVFTIIMILIPMFALVFSLYLSNRYYNPKFRTIEVRSLIEMLALGEGKLYEVMDDHVIGFNLRLRYRELGSGEEYYVNLQVPDDEVKFFSFEEKRRELLGEQPLKGISFHRIPHKSEGDGPMHVGYKFWTINSKAEYMLHAHNIMC